MDDDLEDYMDNFDRLVYGHVRIPKRYIRDQANPFEIFYEEAFRNRFRFTKEQILHFILPIVEENLAVYNNRGLPVPPVIQLLMALRLYAAGSYQTVVGDINSFSQPTVCVCIKRVSRALAEKMRNYVRFERPVEDQLNTITSFYNIAGFPNVAGCIDGTLIKIANPAKPIAAIFRNRKGFLSLNVMMAAVGSRGEFLYIDVRHPGSVHDQTCFNRSALKLLVLQNRIRGLLLGDNGYSCQSYLLTAVLNPLNEAERNYNKSHIKTRNVVERTFERWKRMFSCLQRGLLNKLDNSISIICATALLWNLHIHINYPNDLYQQIDANAPYLDINPPGNVNGLDYRLQFIIQHFR